MIAEWIKHIVPEQCFYKPETERYLVKLINGGIVKASRSNGHWFGMWRWLQDEEVKAWVVLYEKGMSS